MNGAIVFLCRCVVCWFVLGIAGPVLAQDDMESADVDSTAAMAGESAAEEDDPKSELHVGGALRFNLFHKSWEGQEANRDKYGDFAFDTFRINADGSHAEIDLSLEYRFYAGYNMLHHGYFGHVFSGGSELQLGVSRKPFGLLPYASDNWFFNISYYMGMEDDYDLGIKLILPPGPLDLQFAFYKSSEGSYTGKSINSARYSYDVVRTDSSELGYAGVTEPRTNEEVNQFNGRVAYTFSHGNGNSSEFGLSGEYGGLYNSSTRRTGNHWAVAAHGAGRYGRFKLMVEAVGFGFRPENPEGQDDSFIVMGAYDAPYKVASEGSMFLANIAYTIPFDGGLVDALTLYNNYSYLSKANSTFTDSQQNVLGMLVSAGRFLTYVDAAAGKNHPWIGPNYGSALAEGDPDAEWELRLNISLGYYF